MKASPNVKWLSTLGYYGVSAALGVAYLGVLIAFLPVSIPLGVAYRVHRHQRQTRDL